MTFKQLKKRFEELDYDVKYKVGIEGRGYYIRKFGDVSFTFKKSRDSVEHLLDTLQFESDFINSL